MTSSLNLLREYLRLILISEGKVEDLAKQNPNVPVIDLASSDLTPTKKLLPWMVKQVSKGADVEHVRSVASRFAKDGSRLKNKDINSYSEIDELETALDALGASKRSETIQAKSGAVKIYEDDACTVLRIDTKEAAQQYGKGTKWCITMEKEQHYETYKSSNVLFYYVLRKEPLGNNLDKVALAVSRDKDNSIQKIQAFDQADKQMTPKEAGVSAQALTTVKSDVKSQPKAFLARIKSGDKYSDEELFSYWENLGTEQNKIAFLCSVKHKNENLQKLLQNEHDKELKEILSDLISGNAVFFYGRIEWKNSAGQLHRDNDQPAVINADGSKEWYQNDLLHRDGDKPAVINADGTKYWYQNDRLHRDNDQPAVIYSDGIKHWYRNGLLHRDNDQPAVIYSDGIKHWYRNGLKYVPKKK